MGQRPAHVKPPRDLPPSPPVPRPEPLDRTNADPLDPVRYGDWEKRGIAWDF